MLNGDVHTSWTPTPSLETKELSPSSALAHLLLVTNPGHNAKGDFYLDEHSAKLIEHAPDPGSTSYTYSGIGYYHPRFFDEVPENAAVPLGPLLRQHIRKGLVSAELMLATWTDVGTPERLHQLKLQLGGSS